MGTCWRQRWRSRATRFSRGDTQSTNRNTDGDFSMFSSSRQTDFRTSESTLSARRRDHERQIWRCIFLFAPIWILLLFIFKWIGAVIIELAAHLIGHRPRTMSPGCDRSSDWTDELDPHDFDFSLVCYKILATHHTAREMACFFAHSGSYAPHDAWGAGG